MPFADSQNKANILVSSLQLTELNTFIIIVFIRYL